MAEESSRDDEKPVAVDKDGKLKEVDPKILDKISGGVAETGGDPESLMEGCNGTCV